MDIQRTNASKDLNLLVKDGHLSKSEGDLFAILFRTNQQQRRLTQKSLRRTRVVEPPEKKILNKNTGNVFTQIIGSTGSMRNAVEQAKQQHCIHLVD
ncbi:MAG: hypothetical protein ACLUC1_04020 [Enterococcus gallinarum]